MDTDALFARILVLRPGRSIPWFLDVDGVLNLEAGAGGLDDWPAYRSETVGTTRGEQVTITWAPALVDCLNLLTSLGHVDVRWLTSWGIDAPVVLAPALGLHVGRHVLHPGPDDGDSRWWKLLAVRSSTPAEPFFVWTDDHLADEADEPVKVGRSC